MNNKIGKFNIEFVYLAGSNVLTSVAIFAIIMFNVIFI